MSIQITDPRVNTLLKAWHENGREHFERHYQSLDYDSPYYAKTAKDRKKYIALDDGTSGCFLVDKETERVYCIKGYGVPHLRKCVGTVDSLTAHYLEATAARQVSGVRYSRPA